MAGSRRNRLLGRFHAALKRLLRTPAPDLAAFAAKLELAIDQEAATLTGDEACLAALRRDARRFATLSPSFPASKDRRTALTRSAG